MAARQETAEATLRASRPLLPKLLKKLSHIDDPRNPKRCKHQLQVVLLFDILSFVFQYASRREAGRKISRPVFFEYLQAYFPELETLPHQDTLKRVLKTIDIEDIEDAHIHLLQHLIRKKKFQNYLVDKRYLVTMVFFWFSIAYNVAVDFFKKTIAASRDF
ncbi:transposase family protein [Lentibacillus salinarum]|uniref:Transposase family protein n=1 Tax=Lentibacillus salinarum TaxID=446820 RepID=A0ABW3ZZN3_9BACI